MFLQSFSILQEIGKSPDGMGDQSMCLIGLHIPMGNQIIAKSGVHNGSISFEGWEVLKLTFPLGSMGDHFHIFTLIVKAKQGNWRWECNKWHIILEN